MQQWAENTPLSPQWIVENYQRAYHQVHGRDPRVVHMFSEWYSVNGETVHRVALVGEINRLRGLAVEKRKASTDRSVINRLISKLRGL